MVGLISFITIKNALVDGGINKTLDNDRPNFWFLNNGLIIACESYDIDGDCIKLYKFSIVNGGQTTTLIGRYKGKNHTQFYIPCKIVAQKASTNTSLKLIMTRILTKKGSSLI